ncbi:hypothetical protein DES53_115107 [Roseimicrobium gellanilyticum]|uniref:Uncharacterized protein n=2 Tax=Roseimicrobium gellanilyticum TaxID=748857 RepID=A0A366H6S9_9BACT|nr:hypothetical protein DES53_115107 [Roseimicrobium gellanilyticum]
MGWSLSVLAVPVLYLLSVPILWEKYAVELKRSPAWLEAYVRPWVWLGDHTFLQPLMAEYSYWVHQKMTGAGRRPSP